MVIFSLRVGEYHHHLGLRLQLRRLNGISHFAMLTSVTLSGNGNLTLPNSTETIAVNSTGSALVDFETTSVIAQEL
jgi:hypothetical protein